MNTSIQQIYDELKRQGCTVDTFELQNGTLLTFEYAGAIRAISGSSPDITSSTGRTISNNKEISGHIAKKIGLPVPETIVYTTDTHAQSFLEEYGTIVVKPLDAAHGHGVTTGVDTSQKLNEAIKRASQESSTILLQQQVAGVDIRVLIIGGEVAVVAERTPASVVGDGVHTVEWLITTENNKNPLRGENYEKPLNKIDLTLAQAYLGDRMNEVLDKDEVLAVVGTANMGTGGTATECTQSIPEEILRQAENFAQTIGVFTCGVDFMFDREANTWFFIEANSSPSFGLHVWPTYGQPIDVAKVFVDRLFQAYDTLAGIPDDNEVIGGNVSIDIVNDAQNVPAKVDTGADSSAIWASHITMSQDGVLSFVLFDVDSPFYTGKVITREHYKAVIVRSSNGSDEIRYKVRLPVKIERREVRPMFTLADRSQNVFPVLIGRKTLAGTFLVDVTRRAHAQSIRKKHGFATMITEDPYTFHVTHYSKKNSKKGRS